MKPSLHIVDPQSFYYEIDKGIPLPSIERRSKYPFAQMKVGDSFFVPGKGDGARTAITYRQKKHPGERYTFRRKPNGIRVWRMA